MADEERNEDVTPEEEAPTPPEDAAPAEEEAAPAAEDAAPAAEPAAEAPAQADPALKAKDLPPGAELDPLSLEPEKPIDAEERARLEAEAEERARLEAEATADGGEEPVARSGPRVELDEGRSIQATGKRKSSIARVVVRAGSGSFEVNRRPLDEYFPRAHLQTVVRSALVTSGYEDSLDITVRVQGGGIAGQAGAVRHGVAKALTEIDSDLRGELKRRGYLTRDARIKERRKAGLKKARKRPQFSKR
jgi:small subunit ribosomal protein S9